MASAAASFMPSVMRRGADVERAAEDAGEREHVVDLVREVAAPGRDDRRVPLRARRRGGSPGSGLARAKTIASGAIVDTTSSGTVPAETPMKTSAPRSASASEPDSPDRLRARGDVGLHVGEVRAVLRDDPAAVAHRDVADARGEQHVGDRDARRARTRR